MSHEEIEVKFIIDDVQAMRQRIIALGARRLSPRIHEDNLSFDAPDQRLRRQGCLLRLRRDRRAVLTYKEPVADDDPAFKVRREFEVEVGDFDLTAAILHKLGWAPVFRYEKYRETFGYQGAEILLDETPCGAFVEIEASRDAIRTIATQLDLDFEKRLTASYGEIFEAVCAAYGLHCRDMTFDNFQALAIDLRACHLT
jgi:adenylate cyclase class 2